MRGSASIQHVTQIESPIQSQYLIFISGIEIQGYANWTQNLEIVNFLDLMKFVWNAEGCKNYRYIEDVLNCYVWFETFHLLLL